MKKLMLLAVVAMFAVSLSGCNGMRNWRMTGPSWCQQAPCANTAYDPATPYLDGGYMVPPSGVSELPAPGPDSIN